MEAARAGQKAITGTEADLRKLGMAEARERLLELGIKDAEIASACRCCSAADRNPEPQPFHCSPERVQLTTVISSLCEVPG